MYTILPQLKPEVTGLALQEVRAPCNQTRRNPRVCPVIALLIGLACCAGCINQTVTRGKGLGQPGGKVLHSRTIWIWQKDFWGSKD